MDDFLNDWIEGSSDPLPVETKPTLNTQEIRVLSFCEQVFWETGLLPTPEACSEELGIAVTSCRKAFTNETFRLALESRGIDSEGLITPGKLIKQSKALSPEQIVCANVMLNLHDKRSQREKLQFLGISSQKFHAWLRLPQFQEFLNKRAEALLSSSDWQAYRALISNVAAGDNKSLELFFRMRGIYTPQLNMQLNVDVVLRQVLEVVSRHVDDKTMLAIAGELDSIVEAEAV